MAPNFKPPELHIIDGAPGRRPIPVGAINDRPLGDPPRALPAAAKAVWRRVSHEWRLQLSESDRAAFALYCRTAARHEALEALVDKDGVFDFGAKGQPSISAAYRALQLSFAALHKLHLAFGATPATRSRVPQSTISPAEARRGGLEVLRGGRDN